MDRRSFLAGEIKNEPARKALSIMLIASQNAGKRYPKIIPRLHASIRAGLKSRDFYPRAAKSGIASARRSTDH